MKGYINPGLGSGVERNSVTLKERQNNFHPTKTPCPILNSSLSILWPSQEYLNTDLFLQILAKLLKT